MLDALKDAGVIALLVLALIGIFAVVAIKSIPWWFEDGGKFPDDPHGNEG